MSLEPSNRFRFERTITLGHLMSAAVTLGSLVAVYVTMNTRVVTLEVRVPAVEKSIEQILDTQKKAVELGYSQTRALDRLTVLVEEMRTPKKP